MALPVSGPLKISDIVTEFGGSVPDSLTEYYRGGLYVPNTPTNAGVPASGTIRIGNFYGASATVSASYSGTMTEGYYYAGPPTYEEWRGFSPYSGGSTSPTTMSDGKLLSQLFDYYIGGSPVSCTLAVGGFGSDPGSSYFTSITALTTLAAAAATYSYSGGFALWTWGTIFGFSGSGTVGVTIS